MASQVIEYVNLGSTCLEDWQDEEEHASAAQIEVGEWLGSVDSEWYTQVAKPAPIKSIDVAIEFSNLVREWRKATWANSSISQRVSHPAYLKIIGLGPVAVPMLLKQLRVQPDHWFDALEAITRQDPTPPGANIHEMRQAWLDWGEMRGYRSTF